MDERKERQRLKSAFDTTLSGIQGDPWLAQRVLAEAKGDVKVKKKLSFGLSLIIALVLIAATALAYVTLRETAQIIAQTEQENGNFAQWPVEKKIMVVTALSEEGYIEKTDLIEKLYEGGLEQEEINRIADEAISNFVGQDAEEVGFLTIMQAAWGPFDQWTNEERAWYSQVMESVGLEMDGKTFYVEPTGAIDEQKAVEIVRSELAKGYGVDESSLDSYSYIVSFQIPESAESGDKQPYWYVAYSAPDSMPQKNRLFDSMELFVHPETGKLLQSVEEMREILANLPRRPSNELYQAIGSFNDRAEEMGVYTFRKWPLELRAEYSQEITPKVKSVIESGDLTDLMNCGSVDVSVIAQSTYIYGVPQEDSIAQDDACALAKVALEEKYNLPGEILEKYEEIGIYYDITDPVTPLWKFFYNPKSLPVQAVDNGYENPLFNLCYKVEINAYTGEIVYIDEFPFQTLGNELEYDLKWY